MKNLKTKLNQLFRRNSKKNDLNHNSTNETIDFKNNFQISRHYVL